MLRSAIQDVTKKWEIDEKTDLSPELASRTIALNVSVDPAGGRSSQGGATNYYPIRLLLHLPPAGRVAMWRGRRAIKMKMVIEGADALSTPYHLTLLRSQKL